MKAFYRLAESNKKRIPAEYNINKKTTDDLFNVMKREEENQFKWELKREEENQFKL
jgi:hypothetical protein